MKEPIKDYKVESEMGKVIEHEVVAAKASACHVTSVSLNAHPAKSESPCPATVKFSGQITADGKGTVEYAFTRSDGSMGPVSRPDFDGAGTMDVSTTWTLGDAGPADFEGWQAIKIMSPTPTDSAPAHFFLRCTGH